MKLSATVREAVADAEVEISQEEATEARPRTAGPRTGKDGRAEHADVGQRPANVRPRHSRVRHGYCSEPRLAFNRTSCSGTGFISNNMGMHLPRSICGWRRFAAWRTKRQTLVYSVPN
jgi:hypothetical protein